MSKSKEQIQREISSVRDLFGKIENSVSLQIIGQQLLRKRLFQALLIDGHILVEGVPGLAKTKSIKAFANSIGGLFKRVQFTPDLLPADIIGTEVYKPKDSTFEIRQGPVFTNFLLADEINRSPAKVQSALLETMQERGVTIGDTTYKLPDPFIVLATQNPIEQEGTYQLPEAQLDRFAFKVKVTYPSNSEEEKMLDILDQEKSNAQEISSVATLNDISSAKEALKNIYVDSRLKNYIVRIVDASRNPKSYNPALSSLIEFGASPRASIVLMQAGKAEALLNGDDFVSPQHIKEVAFDVLRHRIIPSYEAEAKSISVDHIIKELLSSVKVP